MLMAGCSQCRSIAPLWCSGQFMPHAPLYVEPSPMGPLCGWCGLMPPVFTCFQCGTRQGLYMPGMPAAQAARGQGLVAPVAATSEGASKHEVTDMLVHVAETFLKEGAKQWGQNVGNQMPTWT